MLDLYSLPWRGYRKVRKGVMKRIRRHMQSLNCSSLAEYTVMLENSKPEKRQLQSCLRVTISRFNRDRFLWRYLAEQVFPRLLKHSRDITVWSAGCSCGEEVYSLKILWHRHFPSSSGINILATDAESKCLRRARHGRYPASSLRELDEVEAAESFFKKGPDEFEILPRFKNNIIWKEHDLLDGPPNGKFHLILLRNNLLTYYLDPLRSAVLADIADALHDGCYLIIGAHETLPSSFRKTFSVQGHPCVFRRTRK